MKKITFMACAALLTSAVALNSCKSDDPIGGFEGDADVVKTEFAISLPSQAVGGPNKMPAATVQTNGIDNFQGITGIFLIPFAGQDSIEGDETRLSKNILLTEDLTKANIEGKNSKAKRYANVAIPLTTGSFLFYAKSLRTDGGKPACGSLIAVDTASNNPQTFKFKLDTILPSTSDISTKAGQLMTYLSNVANTTDSLGTPTAWKDNDEFKPMYQTFITMTALSTFEIQRVMTDLYKSLKPRAGTALADELMEAITAPSWVSKGAGDSIKLGGDYTNFPAEYGIPEGCVMTKWNGSNAFIEGDYTNKALPSKFVYPAQLWYTANSTIKTSNKSMESYYKDSTTMSWSDILDRYTGAVAVNTLTRSVAIKDKVQYAVARLDVQVKLNNSSLADNSESAEGVAKAVDCAAGFPITAVLVGGQNHVGYDFKPSAEGAYAIYDNVMNIPDTADATDYSALNHTLVLESYPGKNVRIAIEMKNTADDFYGYNNQLIPKNGKFYVVAELLHASAIAAMDDKVFQQDFTTTAKLNLKNLKSAYNTIPDLRTPELEIGFAVDLTWQAGTVYEIDFE